jgi:hypothetical protein
MAAASNPLQQQVLAALMARSQGGAGAPGGSGQPGQPSPGGASGVPPGGAPGAASGSSPDAGDQYGQMTADLRGADPGGLLRQLKQMKSIVAVMMVQNLERLPNVAGKLSKLIPQFDAVIKEAQQAASVDAAVRQPIQMGAAQPNPQPDAAGGGGLLSQ